MPGSKQSYPDHHPLHLLDDLLASLSPCISATAPRHDQNHSGDSFKSNDGGADAALALAEAKQDVVLRAAGELFGNNISLLENSLTLLDEQEQYQKNQSNEIDHNSQSTAMTSMPVIRKIQAKRSGREVILVRKQRKKAAQGRRKSKGDISSQLNENDKEGKKQNIMDDYYLCLLGRDQIERRSSFTRNRKGGRVYRQGAHCTCRSFFQNIKGGSRSSSSTKSSSEASMPNCSNVVVCKHLLAAVLMPHMLPWSKSGGVDMEVEVVDDRYFAKLIMRASIG